MDLIEREAELALLRDLLARAREGQGGVALVSGVVGAGKTALLRGFLDHAAASGAAFRHATATRDEQQDPFAVTRRLFHDPRNPGTVPENVRPLIEEGARAAVFNAAVLNEEKRPPKAVANTTRSTLPHLCRVLLDLAAHTPLVISVDDAHHADRASLTFLLYLAHRLKSARVLLVLSRRTGPRPENPLFTADLLSMRHSRHIRLDLLSRDGQTRLLAARFGGPSGRRSAAAYHALTGGNPLLTQALVKDNRAAGPDAAEPAVETAFPQAVVGCLQRGGPDLARVAQALAVLPAPAAPELLGGLLGLDTAYVVQVIATMNAAGLLDGSRFRHPAVRAAVLDGVPSAERGALHGRAARLLYEHGTAAPVVAEHLVLSGTAAPWAVPVLEEAAERALADDELHTALSCLHLAVRSGADEHDRARILSALARAEWRIDPAAVDPLLPELLAALRDDLLDTRHALDLPGYLMWHGRPAEAAGVLRRLGGPAAPQPGSRAQDLTAAGLLMTCAYPEEMERLADGDTAVDRRLLASADGRRPRSAALLAAVLTGEPDLDVPGMAEQVLQGARLCQDCLGSVIAALIALVYDDRWQSAARWCDPLLEEAAVRRDPFWHAMLAAVRAVISLRQGDPVTADEHARTSLSRLSPAGWGVAIGVPISVTVLAATAMGRYEDAATHLGVAVPQAMFQTPVGLHYLQARGHFHLATGHPDTALDDFLACGAQMRRWGFDNPGVVGWRTDAARALIELGDTARAAELAEEQLAMLRPGPSRMRGVTLPFRALTTPEPQRRLELLQDAVRILEQFGNRYELAVALSDLSRAQHAVGEHAEAFASAQSAQRLTERYGVRLAPPPVPHQAGGPGRRVTTAGPAADPAADLTEAERRVASLAARGQTNREIADILRITVSTVEQHLTRVYRKLRVDRRTQLHRLLRAGADADAVRETGG